MTDLFWFGKTPELTPEERKDQRVREVEEAKAARGRPAPSDAVDELRAMHEALQQRKRQSE